MSRLNVIAFGAAFTALQVVAVAMIWVKVHHIAVFNIVVGLAVAGMTAWIWRYKEWHQ